MRHNLRANILQRKNNQDFNIITGQPKNIFPVTNNQIKEYQNLFKNVQNNNCLLYTSPSPRDLSTSRMPSSA